MVRRDIKSIMTIITTLYPDEDIVGSGGTTTLALWYGYLADYPFTLVQDAVLAFNRRVKDRPPSILDLCRICEANKHLDRYRDDLTEKAGWKIVLDVVQQESDDEYRDAFRGLPSIVKWSLNSSKKLDEIAAFWRSMDKSSLERENERFCSNFWLLRREEKLAGEKSRENRKRLAMAVLEDRLKRF